MYESRGVEGDWGCPSEPIDNVMDWRGWWKRSSSKGDAAKSAAAALGLLVVEGECECECCDAGTAGPRNCWKGMTDVGAMGALLA